MHISIVIPTTFNRPEYINSLFQSISMQTPIETPFDVIIVDNTSHGSNTLRLLATKWSEKLKIHLIHVAQNGLHFARHAGAKAAKGNVLIFIDDDVLLLPDWLSAYNKFFMARKGICAGGKVTPEWETETPHWINRLTPNYFSLLDYGESELVLQKKQGINGCNFAIEKDAVFKFGGFHPDGYADVSMRWFRGDGEYGLIQKMKESGYDIYYLPTAQLVHRIPKSRIEPKAIQKIVENHAISSGYSFIRKNNGTFLSAATLIIGGAFCGFFYIFLYLVSGIWSNRMIIFYKLVKFFTIAQYGLKILTYPNLKKHVLQKTYIEELAYDF